MSSSPSRNTRFVRSERRAAFVFYGCVDLQSRPVFMVDRHEPSMTSMTVRHGISGGLQIAVRFLRLRRFAITPSFHGGPPCALHDVYDGPPRNIGGIANRRSFSTVASICNHAQFPWRTAPWSHSRTKTNGATCLSDIPRKCSSRNITPCEKCDYRSDKNLLTWPPSWVPSIDDSMYRGKKKNRREENAMIFCKRRIRFRRKPHEGLDGRVN